MGQNYQPPQYSPPPPPARKRRPIWQWGCGALIVLVVCAGVASLATPKGQTNNAQTAVVLPTATSAPSTAVPATTAPTELPAAVPTATLVSTPPATPTAVIASSPPTAVPVAPVAPTSAPSTGKICGAVCSDGTLSSATGKGACSRHGGVDHWTYCDLFSP